jgi:xanthine dehydrogenase accessory factor
MICVDEAAKITGTLGGGCVESDIRRVAHQALGTGRGHIASFELDSDFGHDDGMICGGTMDVAICPLAETGGGSVIRHALEVAGRSDVVIPFRVEREGRHVEYRVRIEASPRLVVAGAGHISRVLAPMALAIGFDVHVIDDRGEFANATRFPDPIRSQVGEIATALSAMTIDTNTFVVIVTRGHKNDEAALRAVINAPARFIGMIGSERKIGVIYDDLRHEGITDAAIARVHAPIGIGIGAVTTEENAVSIAAQLVQVRRRSRRPIVEGPFPVEVAAP